MACAFQIKRMDILVNIALNVHFPVPTAHKPSIISNSKKYINLTKRRFEWGGFSKSQFLH